MTSHGCPKSALTSEWECHAGIPQGVSLDQRALWCWLWQHGWTKADVILGLSHSEAIVIDTLVEEGLSRRDAELLTFQALQRSPRLSTRQADAVNRLAMFACSLNQSSGDLTATTFCLGCCHISPAHMVNVGQAALTRIN